MRDVQQPRTITEHLEGYVDAVISLGVTNDRRTHQTSQYGSRPPQLRPTPPVSSANRLENTEPASVLEQRPQTTVSVSLGTFPGVGSE